MAAIEPFRITPSLGPDLWQVGPYYFDMITAPDVPSYQLGSMVVGNDGHEYIHVIAGGTIASGAQVTAPAGPDWEVTTGTGGYTAPVTEGAVAITEGQPFHARRTAI